MINDALNHIEICPLCGKLSYWNSYFQCWMCNTCQVKIATDTPFIRDTKDAVIEKLIKEVAFWMEQYNNAYKPGYSKVIIDKEKIALDAWSTEKESEGEEK